MNIDEMQAGREMDALIHVMFFGAKVWLRNDGYYFLSTSDRSDEPQTWRLSSLDECSTKNKGNWEDPEYNEEVFVPNYSTDIAAAWEVVDKLDYKSHTRFSLYASGAMWICSFNLKFGEGYFTNLNLLESRANTAPVAICRAALKATGCK